jgi:hypothetical protein
MIGSSLFLGIASVTSWGLSLLLSFVFILVVATLVRRHRPDVAPVLLLAVGLDVVVTAVSLAAQVLLPRLLLGDMTRYAEAQALNTIVTALLHAITRGLLIWSVVRLASPTHESQSPY